MVCDSSHPDTTARNGQRRTQREVGDAGCAELSGASKGGRAGERVGGGKGIGGVAEGGVGGEPADTTSQAGVVTTGLTLEQASIDPCEAGATALEVCGGNIAAKGTVPRY